MLGWELGAGSKECKELRAESWELGAEGLARIAEAPGGRGLGEAEAWGGFGWIFGPAEIN